METGFSPEAVDLLAELRDNNNRDWFQANRERVEKLLLTPAREMVVAVGELLRDKRPQIIADPRTDHSIYRLNRDTRFSRDKTPYKTHLALWLWEGDEGRLSSPGFYFHLSPEGICISVGCYRFSEVGLSRWRQALMHPQKGLKFQEIIQEMKSRGALFREPVLKRIPPGFDREHPLALWLRHKGFFTWQEEAPHPQQIFGQKSASYLVNRFSSSLKLHEWLFKTLSSGKNSRPPIV